MSEKKWVLVLGAGKDQLEILRAVKRAGYRSMAFDSDRVCAGRVEADEILPISNRDSHEILHAAREHMDKGCTIAGVIAAGSEVPEVVATVQHRLGLPGMPVAAAFALRDKRLYKLALRAAGVPCTREANVHDKLTVLKPTNGSGSRNVVVGPHPALAGRPAHEGEMVEAYQPGPQISSETLVWDKLGVTVAFADRHYDHANMTHPKELGVSMPSRWEAYRAQAHGVAMHAAAALGITRGTIKCDLVLTAQGPLIIECTSRLSGGPLAKLVRESIGIDYFREAVHMACGERPSLYRVFDIENPPNVRNVSLDMDGNENDYEEVQKWIPKELPECA